MRQSTGHYIRKNDTSRIPRYHVIIDTETRGESRGNALFESWRCGVAAFCQFMENGTWKTYVQEYTDPVELWNDVAVFCRTDKRTVLWAHNLSFDLRTSQALKLLPPLGFELKDIRLSQTGTWAKWRKNKTTLIAMDSVSIWPCSLEKLAGTFGMGKVSLPRSDDMEAWLERCRRDVEILTIAVQKYVAWLKDADMGSFQITGAGQSWAAFRHRHYTHKILVADDLGAREAERRAMWTGRAEAWAYGTDMTAPVYDMDFENAYPRIAAEVQLPVRQYAEAQISTLEGVLELAKRFCVLAEVNVSTMQPVAPAEFDNRIVWPVGSFDTVLWDPELRLLHDSGCETQIGRVWLYHKRPALRAWATWILGQLHQDDNMVPAWQKIILKNWSRALIGRFAMKYKAWDDFATAPNDDLQLMDGYDLDEDKPFTLLQIGQRIMILGEETEGNDSVPAITGYIMSEARVRLWNAIQRLGPEHVLYIDTDSLLTTATGYRRYREMVSQPEFSGLRLKRRFRGYSIAGPRQLILGNEPRISGIPKTARRVGEWRFEGEVWRGLGESIRAGEPDQVRISSRSFRVMKIDRKRRRLRNGRTTPIRLDGANGKASAGKPG